MKGIGNVRARERYEFHCPCYYVRPIETDSPYVLCLRAFVCVCVSVVCVRVCVCIIYIYIYISVYVCEITIADCF